MTSFVKTCKYTAFSSRSFCQIYRVTDEAETAVWPNFFLMKSMFSLFLKDLNILYYLNVAVDEIKVNNVLKQLKLLQQKDKKHRILEMYTLLFAKLQSHTSRFSKIQVKTAFIHAVIKIYYIVFQD